MNYFLIDFKETILEPVSNTFDFFLHSTF